MGDASVSALLVFGTSALVYGATALAKQLWNRPLVALFFAALVIAGAMADGYAEDNKRQRIASVHTAPVPGAARKK